MTKNQVLIASIKQDYRDIILFMAINPQIQNNIAVYSLTALSIKSIDYNQSKKGINRSRKKARELLDEFYINKHITIYLVLAKASVLNPCLLKTTL